MKTTDNKTELNFSLSIPFSEKSAQNRAKQAGAKWNSSKKVWEVATSIYKIDNIRNLSKYVIETYMTGSELELWRNR